MVISQEELYKGNKGGRSSLPHEYFVPSSYVNELFSCLEQVKQSVRNNQSWDSAALGDCYMLALIGNTEDGSFILTPSGKRFLSNAIEAKEIMKDFLLSKPNVVNYLTKIGQNPTPHVTVLKETLSAMVTWENTTWTWRSKVLVNWLTYTELVRRRKGQVTSYPSRLL